ncbi:MAG: hypothetical protein R6U40_09550 [Desulfobacterales bacterium]
MKSGLTTIAALLLMFQAGGTSAANLKYVRTAKHRDFTRIVFEFRNAAQFKEPVIEGQGKFSVAFYDSTTILPRRIVYKTTQIRPVRSIEFTQKETLLTAVVQLSFPDFELKAFSLTDPNRVVIDAYKTTPASDESVPKEILHAKPMAGESMEGETKKPQAVPEESLTKQLNKVPAALIKPQSAPDEPATPRQIKPTESLPSTHENYTLQTYMLILLNFLTIVIVLLLSVNLLKKKSGINSKPVGKISDALKTVDERIAAIDTIINRELKKHD